MTESERAQYDALAHAAGQQRLYNFDYDKALKDFKELDRLFPNHPAGPQLLAARVWIKTLYESRRLAVVSLQLREFLFKRRRQSGSEGRE